MFYFKKLCYLCTIILYLINTGLLKKPVLYISDFFERNRSSYYDALAMVKESSKIEVWLKFFLSGVVETAKSSIKNFDEIIKLKKVEEDFNRKLLQQYRDKGIPK